MKIKRIVITVLGSLCLFATNLPGQVPNLVNYQGRVSVGSTNFNSPPDGQFKFALVNASGTVTYWRNSADTAPADGVPDAAVALTVTKGLYAVLLGDSTITNMAVIPTSVWTNPDVRLRVWFSDGTNGFQQLTPDQRLAPNGYLPDGSVSAGAIASEAVTTAKIAASAVTNTQIATGIDAAKITTGTLPAAQVPANVALRSSVLGNAFTGDQVVSGGGVFRVTDGTNNGNIVLQNLTPAQSGSGYQTINFNGYYTGSEFRFNPGKARYRLVADQRGTADLFTLETFDGTTINTALSVRPNGNVGIGNTALSVLPNGNVGIGTTTPASRLHLSTGGNTELSIQSTESLSVFGIETEVGNRWALQSTGLDTYPFGSPLTGSFQLINRTAGATRLVVLGDGRVGIGTTNPGATLQVAGGILARGGAPGGNGSLNNGYAFASNGGDTDSGMFSSADGQIEFFNNGIERIRITQFGDVGIGTTNPATKLDVRGSITFPAFSRFLDTGSEAPRANMDNGTIGYMRFSQGLDIIGAGSTAANRKLTFWGDASFDREITCVAINITSDRNAKEDFKPVNARSVLDKVARLSISEWQYKTQSDARHIGPMAQDFREAFALGHDEKHIASVDADGVALAAIQGLNEKLDEQGRDKDARIKELEKSVGELKNLVEQLARQSSQGKPQ